MIKVKTFPFMTILILVCVFVSSTGTRYLGYLPISFGDGDHRHRHVPIPANPYRRGCEASQKCQRSIESLLHNFWNYFLENNVNTG